MKWVFSPLSNDLRDEIARSLRISPIVSHILINRGVTDVGAAKMFLRPQLSFLRDPALLPDIEKSAKRIIEAITNGEKITVYGDYDVDGISATALMVQCLEVLSELTANQKSPPCRQEKSEISYYIPDRLEEGYGLNMKAIEMLGRTGTKVIITVDCGSNSFAEAEVAKKNGIDLIVTDHHEPSYPECSQPYTAGSVTEKSSNPQGNGVVGSRKQHNSSAFSVINPKLLTSSYPFRELSGVGVAFMLAWALGKRYSNTDKVVSKFKEFLMNAMSFVALGTIADVVPLKNENRILAKYGLNALHYAKQPGINALKEVAGLKDRPIDSHHVGFCLGPRINAAGRIGNAKKGVELLTAGSAESAKEIAQYLENENRKRKKIQNDILASAKNKIMNEMDVESETVIIVADDNWHPGVIGIVASRLVGEYYKPVILISTEDEVGHGSARSIPDFHLYDALVRCENSFSDRKLLISFGGHSQAAGLRILKKNIPEFKKRLYDVSSEYLNGENLIPTLHIDLEIELSALSKAVLHELGRLSPHGEGNPVPVFAARGVSIVGQVRRFGVQGQHSNFYVRQGDTTCRAVAFGLGMRCEMFQKSNAKCSIAFVLKDPAQTNGRTVQNFSFRNGAYKEQFELEVKDISP
ncbi:MAG: DHHA1 domain-containing protein [Candidatus Scalindua sp.]|nr:DHHA1 domain-containing protein [Candidatus Scalindua sp.]